MIALDAEMVRRVRGAASRAGVDGIVLTTPGAVAWATGGWNIPIDRTAATDTIWVAVGPDRQAVVTTNVEAPRLAANVAFEDGCSLESAPWWDAEHMVRVACAAVGSPASAIGSDGHSGFGLDLGFELTRERLALTDSQQRSFAEWGRIAAAAVESALRAWRPGETDHAIAARIAEAVERAGGQCPVLLVGGDDRVASFRHPVAIGAPVARLAMAVLVASREGHHVALTRFASQGPIDDRLAGDLDTVRAIHGAALLACTPGATLGSVMTRLADAYAEHGHKDAWRDHYQGGPIGYAQRECEIAPVQTESPWWNVELPLGCAVAFNPSIAGGAKDEDTYLVDEAGPRWITTTDDWPTTADPSFPRPAVLEIQN